LVRHAGGAVWEALAMCGRFTMFASKDEIALLCDLGPEAVPDLPLRYNVAPTQPVAAVRAEGGGRALAMLRWGLIPSWAKDQKIGHSLINARSETAAEKPSFRVAMRRRRCLILMTGYYEWQATGSKHKQPYHVARPDGRPFAVAGLWDVWEGPEGPVESCALLTTEANEAVRPVHDRMPAVLDPADFGLWLDPAVQDPAAVLPLLKPFAGPMAAAPVSTWVNSPRNEGPRCLAS
jgi:putative SOS response-associated peptidase YedK